MIELDLFIKSLKSEKTKNDYKIWIEDFLEYKNIKEVEQLKDINVRDIVDWVDFLRKEKNNLDNSIKPKCQGLSSFFLFLMEDQNYGILNNPVIYVLKKLKPQKNPSRRTFLTIEEQELFLSECKSKREIAMFTLFLNNGLRVSELINLNLNDFGKVISPTNGEEIYYINIVRKGGKIQRMRLNNDTAEAINDYIENGRKQSVYNNLFISNGGKPMSTSCIDKSIKKIKDKAGISKNISAHSLRRSIATTLHNQGVDIDGIKNVLGHASISTTQIYLQDGEENANQILTNYSVAKLR